MDQHQVHHSVIVVHHCRSGLYSQPRWALSNKQLCLQHIRSEMELVVHYVLFFGPQKPRNSDGLKINRSESLCNSKLHSPPVKYRNVSYHSTINRIGHIHRRIPNHTYHYSTIYSTCEKRQVFFHILTSLWILRVYLWDCLKIIYIIYNYAISFLYI